MTLAFDLQTQRWELVKLAAAIFQPVLVLLLCAGFVLAASHLLTMLGTRWGRRRVSLKALLFSLAVHLCLVFGITAMWPDAIPANASAVGAEEQPAPEAFKIKSLDADAALARNETIERPPWEQTPRLPTADIEPTPVEFSPEIEPDPLRPQPPELATLVSPELTPLPRPDDETPTPLTDVSPNEFAPIDVPLEAQAPSAERRDDVDSPPVRERTPLTSPAVVEVLPAARPQPPSPQPAASEFDPQPPLPAGADAPDEIARLEDPEARRPETGSAMPAPSLTIPSDESVAALRPDPGADPDSATGSAGRRRSTPRDSEGVPDADIERYRPPTAPTRPADPSDTTPLPTSLAATTGATPLVERPQLEVPTSSGASRVPAPYRARAQELRQEATRRYGGNADSERAVRLSLEWLARVQHPDGYWDADAHGAGRIARSEGNENLGFVGQHSDSGVTGLALLSFLGAGNTSEKGTFAPNVKRALTWLISQQKRDGSLAGNASPTEAAYCHAMAAFSLAEAYALRSSEETGEWLRLPVQRAIQFTLDNRTPDGGWRYLKTEKSGDMSVFGWHLMSLKSAELAGVAIPSQVREQMVGFLIGRSVGKNNGLAGYRAGDPPTPSMTAECLFCKQILGLTRNNPASAEAVAFLEQHPPQRSQMNFYYWYYGTLAMFQHGGEAWERWNVPLRDLLVADQRRDGLDAGSWDPRDVWGPYGGRIYSTAIATLCLEVYYRYLPLYRLGEQPGEQP